MNIVIEGDKDLIKALKAMPKEVEKAIVTASHTTGFVVEGKAKRLCPVISDNLRSSIHTTKEQNGAMVGTPVPYGKYVEGVVLVSEGRKITPFLYPALRDSQDFYKKEIKGEIKDLLK